MKIARVAGSIALLFVATSCLRRSPVATPAERLRADVERARVEQGPADSRRRATGSLWDAEAAASLVADPRAHRVGDLVTVTVVERTRGAQEATTDLNKNSTLSLKTPALFGLEKSLAGGNLDPNLVLDTSTQKAFKGDGATTRETSVVASVTARVIGVYPNGDLAIVGQKDIDVNHERQVLTVAGIARPADLGSDNAVSSDRLAELAVHLGGRGDVDGQQREGWLSRLIQRVWPF